MIDAQNQRVLVPKFPGILIDNAAVTITAVDTQYLGVKYDYVEFLLILGATDIALTVVKLTESDDDSSYSDVSGTTFGAGTAPALPTATDDNKIWAIRVDARHRKRYLKLAVTVGDGTVGGYVVVVALLSRAKETPNTATKRGLAAELNI